MAETSTDTKSTELQVKPETGPADEPSGRWELAKQWSLAWKALKWSATALVVIGFLMVIGQGYLFYQLFSDIHPALGVGFVIVLTLLLLLLVVRPVMGFLSMPVMAEPPEIRGKDGTPDLNDLAERLKYDARYLKALSRNPELGAAEKDIAADMAKLVGQRARVKAARPEQLAGLTAEVTAFENECIAAHLKGLDAKADKIIRAEAIGVGVATAASLNGTIDAFIVLWRAANLISRIARLYFGRPHLGGSLRILRDVAVIVVVSRAVDDISDLTGDVVGSVIGRMGGLVAGPVMDGAINATMTLKLGHLAKRRCRSFEAWTPERASGLAEEALKRVRTEAGSVVGELLKKVGGLSWHAARAAQAAMQGSKTTWTTIRGWFGKDVSEPSGQTTQAP